MSAAAFARKYGLNYSTFAAWRHRSAQKKQPIAFAQVELASSEPTNLTMKVRTLARVRLTSGSKFVLTRTLSLHGTISWDLEARWSGASEATSAVAQL
ncbi:MAG: hypothetical protein JNN07_03640 [Verrucomicrobiales bacterium]|nr:hypothetical protein [Verrucomicrobiales bacterium]